MPRLGHVASLIAEAKSDQTDFHLARIDHQAAYRQLPLTKQDASYAAGLFIHTDGSVQVVKPLVAPFGAIGSVSAYLRNHALLTSKLTGKTSFCCEALLGRLATRTLITTRALRRSTDEDYEVWVPQTFKFVSSG
ncbi:hypothetical protein Pmar_PMAR023822 [Perkinsus marinus ATCC 50983]|uniref:Uncharacterized protein n=1 Tax=Perkinsus marinus (strain ATCC 50983 / TXsc) TaxID=423536 RepID=C5KYL3_PERM5|nr:hypothetical protein Pmar_PMAR023822 [Perkinsus marinus ATCC 50983]EER10448.1 hypothetical protein Pmar_PMAR023822 [Perkinsus marinus ATCC 50983]|eukprot:XP_002778653.1 hypothetical protein Pmar_PMAR023822 [Perkinsus marinus ATCC 50983]